MTGFCRSLCQLSVVYSLLATLGCAPAKINTAQLDPRQMISSWGTDDTRGLALPTYNAGIAAFADPPIGWKPDPPKIDANHVHQVWVSPTTDTAYGIIHFKLPLPVGAGLALAGFLDQMKKTQGDATLLERQDDPKLPGVRFTARGGVYTLRANLIVQGWEGWAVYAGTQRGKPIDSIELDFAVRAREHTAVGRPESSGK
jgi:hypothetical protein